MKEKIDVLIQKIQQTDSIDKDDDLRTVIDVILTFNKYVSSVCAHVIGTETLSGSENSGEVIGEYDKKRTAAHNAAISGINALNSLCDLYHVKKVYDGDPSDRRMAGEYIIDIIDEIYKARY